MKLIKISSAVLNILLVMVMMLGLPAAAYADWSQAGLRPATTPNFSPDQRQLSQHDIQVNRVFLQHLEPQHRALPATRVGAPARDGLSAHGALPVRVEPQHRVLPIQSAARPTPQPVKRQVVERHDKNSYRQHEDIRSLVERPIIVENPTIVISSQAVVPDGFKAVDVDGQFYYYYQGSFYQNIGGQLTAIPAVLGAVVDEIPQDYQIVMADGVNYCVWKGVYYQRLVEGFQVVLPPTPLEV